MASITSLSICLVLLAFTQVLSATYDEIYNKQKNIKWFKDGTDLIKRNLNVKNVNKKAKGGILFLGDGMGFTTVAAGRILDGQIKNQTGEENVLSWERFRNVGFSKTYNTDYQVADSAGTASAFMTGVKTKAGTISVDDNVQYQSCSSQLGAEVLSIIMMAEQEGLSTGVVTTARITHATPATAYAHSSSRNWESDSDIPPDSKDCPDIARQLIEFKYGDSIDVALGGGRKNFLPEGQNDPKDPSQQGKRADGRNLVQEWQDKSNDHIYVWNRTQFNNLSPNCSKKVLGLFSYSHMDYEINRGADQPSLTEMVEFAIKTLAQNPKGYFLLVEGGRIDHGHHAAKPIYALNEVVQLNKAVQKGIEMTNSTDTLLVVTADHSHVFTFGGYQKRGNNIFGRTNEIALDNKTFETLGYNVGPGANPDRLKRKGRYEASATNLKDPEYRWESLVPYTSETHGGEDVGIYSNGPQGHLLRGVVEQNYIFHVFDYSLCLSESKKRICRRKGMLPKPTSSSNRFHVYNSMTILIIAAVVFILQM